VNRCTGPSASMRPATTGSLAPGSQVQTNAVRGLEVVIGAYLPGINVRGQQRQTVTFADSQASQIAGRKPVQFHANESRKLEHHTHGDRGFAPLSIAQRDLGDAGTLAQLSLCPLAAPTTFGDPQSQYASSIQRLGRVCMTAAHRTRPSFGDWYNTPIGG
jgi:hypothetical protein